MGEGTYKRWKTGQVKKAALAVIEQMERLASRNDNDFGDPKMERLGEKHQELSNELIRRGVLGSGDLYSPEHARKSKRKAAIHKAAKEPEPIVWLGTDRDFGDAVFKLHRKNLIRGKSWFDALKILATHFVDNDGNNFDPESIRESIRSRENREMKGGPGKGLEID